MSDLEIFLYINCIIFALAVNYLIAKNDSLKYRLHLLEEENKEMEEIIYGSKSN